ncbi:restriction endonuclease [candidate division KSB1 bacterium]|nr:restriction endonuclease [candidate division KSB1 bacterium]
MISSVNDLEKILHDTFITVDELVRGGGGEGQLTQRMRRALESFGWKKHKFEIKKLVDGMEREFISHEIDHIKSLPCGNIALEIEWNNKDPFYDRDLDNFKRLHAEGVISIGVIITRGQSLQNAFCELIEKFAITKKITNIEELKKYYNPTVRQIQIIEKTIISKGTFEKGWAHAFVSDKFGEATTHWRKLEDRMNRGVGNPCPLLLIGLPREIVIE